MRRHPTEQLGGQLARDGVVEPDERGEIAEVLGDVIGGDGLDGHAEVPTDGRGDLAERHTPVAHRVQPCAGRRRLQRQAVQVCRVACVDGRPPVRPVPGVAGDAGGAGDADQGGPEAMVVERAVHQGREADLGGPDATLGQCDHGVLGVDPHAALEDVTLGARTLRDARQREHQGSPGADEGLARTLQRLPHGFDGTQVGGDRAGIVADLHRLVLEGQMDDAVGRRDRLPEAVEIVQVAAPDLGAQRLERQAEASERARPTTSCPDSRSSGMTAEPMCPLAPVTKTRMGVPPAL